MPRIDETRKYLLGQNVDPVPPETVILEKTAPGNYTLQIPGDGYYQIYCVGAGGHGPYDSDFLGPVYYNE